MRGVKACVTASLRRPQSNSPPLKLELLVFSPFGGKGLVTQSAAAGGNSLVGYVAPFWAVLLTDRDNQELVNMIPYTVDFRLPHPESRSFGVRYTCVLDATMHFLTNKSDLNPGDLLVLPFDGGCTSIFSESPAANASSTGYEPTLPSD